MHIKDFLFYATIFLLFIAMHFFSKKIKREVEIKDVELVYKENNFFVIIPYSSIKKIRLDNRFWEKRIFIEGDFVVERKSSKSQRVSVIAIEDSNGINLDEIFDAVKSKMRDL